MKQVGIYYFIANGKEWVQVKAPYNPAYVSAIRKIPTAHYDIEEKAWCCNAVHGKAVEELVSKHFPNAQIDRQDNRNLGDLF